LFKPAPAYRVRRDTNTDTPLPPDEPAGENPPDGAIIDYSLQSASDVVTIEILDSAGKLVRKYASNDKAELTPEQLQQQLIPTYWVRPFRALPNDAGMHRWVWDLRYTAPLATRRSYPIAAVPHDTPRTPEGPLVLPGQYTVRLTANGQSYTAPVVVKMDPRVKTPAAALAQQFKVQMQLADLMNHVAPAVIEARSVREQLEKVAKTVSGANAESVKSVQQKVAAILEGPEEPSATNAPALSAVNSTINTLYEQVGMADTAPTAVQVAESDRVQKEAIDVVQRWNEIKNRDLPALNRQLKTSGTPEINPEQQSQTQQDEGDED
jgi:hypothetical protein